MNHGAGLDGAIDNTIDAIDKKCDAIAERGGYIADELRQVDAFL